MYILLVIPLLTVILGFSAGQEVKENLTGTVGGAVTLPDAVTETETGFLLYKETNIALVFNGVLKIIDVNTYQNKLQWNRSSGLFKITNLQRNDSGIYTVQRGEIPSSYNLQVYACDLKNVVEGGNVTLTPEISMKEEYTVNWRQQNHSEERVIAQWKNFKSTINIYKDVLLLDPKNGSLTFIRIRREHSGNYSFQILDGKEEHSGKCYKITVYEPVSVPYFTTNSTEMFEIGASPSDKTCYVACFVKNGPDVNLTWFNGSTIISSVNNSMNVSMTLSLPLKIQQENKENFTCDARNPVTVERKTLSPTIWCPSRQRCPSCDSDPCYNWKYAVWGLVGSLLVFLLVFLVVTPILIFNGIMVIQCRRRPSCMRNGTQMNQVENSQDSVPADSESDPLQQN